MSRNACIANNAWLNKQRSLNPIPPRPFGGISLSMISNAPSSIQPLHPSRNSVSFVSSPRTTLLVV
jgi:hypothetical protein